MLPKSVLRLLPVLAVASGLALVSACSGDDEPSLSVAQAGVSREEDPPVTAEGLAPLVEANTAFATDLYAALRTREGNLFFSPYSISVALAMTYAGAAGDTASEMADTLHFGPAGADLHPAFNR